MKKDRSCCWFGFFSILLFPFAVLAQLLKQNK